MTMAIIEVGKSYPLPYSAAQGMRVLIEPGEEAPHILLQCTAARLTPKERLAMKTGRLRIGLTPSSPLVWFVLLGQGVSFDAPYAVGRHAPDIVEDIKASIALSRAWAPHQRQLIEIHVIDTTDGITAALRVATVSAVWMQALSSAVAQCPIINETEQIAAITRDNTKWTSTDALLKDAVAVETIGAI